MEADNKKIPFEALLHVGDIAYASVAMTDTKSPVKDHGDGEVVRTRGPPKSDDQELVWDLWEKQVEPLAGQSLFSFETIL